MKVAAVRAAIAALVLALGIALGAGPLQEDHERRARALTAQQEKLADRDRQIADLTRSGEFSADFARATASRLVRGTLTGRTVAVVHLPGADPETVAELRDLVTAAGGEITADVPLTGSVSEPAQQQLVTALTSQMATQEKLTMPEGASGYQRFGLLLARALGLSPTGSSREAPYDATALGIISGFQTADLVTTTASVTKRAALTLVVAGPQQDPESGETDLLATVVRAYAGRARVVVAGPTPAASDAGVLGLLRGPVTRAGLLSTVDTSELAGGRVAAVLALAARMQGTVGSYGAVGADDGPVPPLR